MYDKFPHSKAYKTSRQYKNKIKKEGKTTLTTTPLKICNHGKNPAHIFLVQKKTQPKKAFQIEF